MNEYLEYNGKKFPYREVYHKASGMNVPIGSGSLDRELFDDEGIGYANEHARYVDEKFYGFIEDRYFDLPDDEFEDLVNDILD